MMTILDHVKDNEKCTGCGACCETCPAHAITMIFDEEGFLKPEINQTACINCGKCDAICPSLHPQYDNLATPECYAAYSSDEVIANSTSGGAFFCIAKHFIENNGVVFGAAYTDDFFVQHVAIMELSELHRICHTKYVQSNTANTFSEVKKYLEEGRTVLYSGCSCQIAGIKAFLGKTYENLLLVDILCMQAPPAPLFRRYLDETYGGLSNVVSVQFRDKTEGWTAKNLRVTTKEKVLSLNDFPLGWLSECKTEEYSDKVVYHRDVQYDAYLKIFYEKLTMNTVCANCQFATFPRQGDISLGDFWGIQKRHNSFDDRGTSLILINSPKGEVYFNTIKNVFEKYEKQPLEDIGGNRVKGVLPQYTDRQRLYELLKMKTVEEAVVQCKERKYDIGIVGGWTTTNYGGALTYYALYHTLNDMGFSTNLITHPFKVPWKAIIQAMKYEKFPYPQYAFRPAPTTITGMKDYNKICDTFIVGSDQLFNYMLYRDMQGFVNLSWVHDNKRKIAYAASFGLDDFYGPEDERARLQYFLSKFDFFSVREESGIEVARKRFDRDAQWVLDPVFLCDTKHYDALIDECKCPPPEEQYMFSYMLDTDSKREEILRAFSEKLELSVNVIDDALKNVANKKLEWTVPTILNASNNQFLAYIKNAKYIVTDSFHGMCFCIIFKIPFTAIVNSKRGSTRMESLAKLFGLESRLIKETSGDIVVAQLSEKVDFERVHAILDRERARCIQWLHNSITQDIGLKQMSEYDILDARMDRIVNLILKNQSQKQVQQHPQQIQQQMPESQSRNFCGEKFRRKVRSGLKCLKENGTMYTLRRVVVKLRNKLSREGK